MSSQTDQDDKALEEYIQSFIEGHRVVFVGVDERGDYLFRPARPYCPACLGDDHEGACPKK